MVKIEITLKFIGTGINNYYQAMVMIYDGNNLVYCGKTVNGIIKLFLEKNKAYCLKAILFNRELITSFIVNCEKIVFNMNNYLQNNPVTFRLTDYNYPNLPIMKGVIYLGKSS